MKPARPLKHRHLVIGDIRSNIVGSHGLTRDRQRVHHRQQHRLGRSNITVRVRVARQIHSTPFTRDNYPR